MEEEGGGLGGPCDTFNGLHQPKVDMGMLNTMKNYFSGHF